MNETVGLKTSKMNIWLIIMDGKYFVGNFNGSNTIDLHNCVEVYRTEHNGSSILHTSFYGILFNIASKNVIKILLDERSGIYKSYIKALQ